MQGLTLYVSCQIHIKRFLSYLVLKLGLIQTNIIIEILFGGFLSVDDRRLILNFHLRKTFFFLSEDIFHTCFFIVQLCHLVLLIFLNDQNLLRLLFLLILARIFVQSLIKQGFLPVEFFPSVLKSGVCHV